MGVSQGVSGAVLGGISGGFRAAKYGGNIWTGKPPGSPGIERASILVPESRAELDVVGRKSNLQDLDTKIIEIERFHENSTGTVSEMKLGDESILYSLEPAGPSSTIANSDRRIMEGIYEIKNYSSSKFKNVFELQNIPGRTQVLFHAGNFPSNTTACILPGTCFNWNSSVENSARALNILRNYINNNGGARNIFIYIHNNF